MSVSPPSASPQRGLLVILSSPSGAGKTTLARRLLAEFPSMEFSVSYTTRQPRKNERDGVDYHFVEPGEFERMCEAGEFAEWALVHGNYYGTARATVEEALVGGRDVIFDIDWQGGRALAEKWPRDALKVFILPPDFQTLAGRLRGRGTDAEGVIRRRLDKALDEIEHHREYEHVIVNDDLEAAYALLRAIYLVRHFGDRDRDDVHHPLTAMGRMVAEHRASDPGKYAETLLAEGRQNRPD